jgi:hypothetical protein
VSSFSFFSVFLARIPLSCVRQSSPFSLTVSRRKQSSIRVE